MPANRLVINGVEQIDPRHTRAWRNLRDRVVSEEPTCRLRFPDICTTVSTTADHIEPVEQRPELALERTNLRGACRPCNRARGTTPNAALRLGDTPTDALTIFKR